MKLGRQIASGWELDHRPQVVGENLQDLRNASLGFLGAVGRSWPRSSNILLLSAAAATWRCWAFRDAYVQIFFILKTFIPFSAEMVLLHLSLTSRVSITTTPTRAKRKGQKKQRLKGILYTLQIESKIDHMETQISDTKRPERLPK